MTSFPHFTVLLSGTPLLLPLQSLLSLGFHLSWVGWVPLTSQLLRACREDIVCVLWLLTFYLSAPEAISPYGKCYQRRTSYAVEVQGRGEEIGEV